MLRHLLAYVMIVTTLFFLVSSFLDLLAIA
jgi:hypothetical protein